MSQQASSLIFLHGLDSSSRGTKGSYFRKNFANVLLPDFQGDLNERMTRLYELTHELQELTLIGSSFGGMMATIYALEKPDKVTKIFLMAPALNFPEFKNYSHKQTAVPAIVYQGTEDTVTPLSEIKPASEKIFKNLTFHELVDDHMLHNSFQTINWGEIIG